MEHLSEMLKGVLEGIVLELISRDEIYGYEIVRRLGSLGFEGVVEGSVYAVLMRLERGRLVQITKKPSAIGPPRKFYTLNVRGQQALADFWARWAFLSEHIEQLRNNGGESA
jgi:PadR family transcriptional regulator PadR